MNRRTFLSAGLALVGLTNGVAAIPPVDDKWAVLFFDFLAPGDSVLVYIGPFNTPRYYEAVAMGSDLVSRGYLQSTSHYCAGNRAEAYRYLDKQLQFYERLRDGFEKHLYDGT